jgi:uncharacterized membrane protein YraQ (UPF0718 family)
MKIKKSEKSPTPLIFLLISVLIFFILILIKPEQFWPIIKIALSTLETILPSLILVFVLLVITNYFINQKTILKYFKNKKSWIIAVIGGLLSSGPIYMWYPLLSELQEKGIKNGFIATFLYNRAIKLPLLPLMISYFGMIYVFVLAIVMIITSIFQGIIINKIMGVKE